ncbi:MAG: hypothetical protein JW763_09435 [candidate division Zixibacteria bacterium]|nr:hypothetical protein [candidate division Zixibacteria bacterium]
MSTQTHQILNLLIERKISLDETERLLDLMNRRDIAIGGGIKNHVVSRGINTDTFGHQVIDLLVPRIDMGNIYPYI